MCNILAKKNAFRETGLERSMISPTFRKRQDRKGFCWNTVPDFVRSQNPNVIIGDWLEGLKNCMDGWELDRHVVDIKSPGWRTGFLGLEDKVGDRGS